MASQVNPVGDNKLQREFGLGVRLMSLTLMSFDTTLQTVSTWSYFLVSNISIGGVRKSQSAVLALCCDDDLDNSGLKKGQWAMWASFF